MSGSKLCQDDSHISICINGTVWIKL